VKGFTIAEALNKGEKKSLTRIDSNMFDLLADLVAFDWSEIDEYLCHYVCS